MQLMVQDMSLETICSEGKSFLRCIQTTYQNFPQECDREQYNVNRPNKIVGKVLKVVEDVCANDLPNIRKHLDCYTSPKRVEEIGACFQESYERQRNSTRDYQSYDCSEMNVMVTCAANKITRDRECKVGASRVFSKVVGQVAAIKIEECEEETSGYNSYYSSQYLDWMNLF